LRADCVVVPRAPGGARPLEDFEAAASGESADIVDVKGNRLWSKAHPVGSHAMEDDGVDTVEKGKHQGQNFIGHRV
jgi:hypothetical protein